MNRSHRHGYAAEQVLSGPLLRVHGLSTNAVTEIFVSEYISVKSIGRSLHTSGNIIMKLPSRAAGII